MMRIRVNKISVLMTVYNSEETISKSIKCILDQSYRNFEFIIVNDGSNDRTLELIKRFKDKRIKLFNLKKNIGRTKALNYGLKKTSGEYIAINDSDDFSGKKRLENQLNYLIKNEDTILAGSYFTIIDTNKKKKKINLDLDSSQIKKIMIYKNIFAHSSIMFRKNKNFKNTIYPNEFIYMQDYIFILLLMKIGKLGIVKKQLVVINEKKSSMTRTLSRRLIAKEKIKSLIFTYKNFKKDFMTFFFWSKELVLAVIKWLFKI